MNSASALKLHTIKIMGPGCSSKSYVFVTLLWQYRKSVCPLTHSGTTGASFLNVGLLP